jgi:HTH-type transcriptional regulator / antitoxin HigA
MSIIGGIAPESMGSAYFDLVQRFPLRPLRSEEGLDRAIAVIDGLLDKEALVPDEQDYLDVLSDLVKRYETDEHPMAPVSDRQLLQHLLEARGTTQSELARETGIAESTISEVLSGKRTLNRRQIGKVSRYFGIQPGTFSFSF